VGATDAVMSGSMVNGTIGDAQTISNRVNTNYKSYISAYPVAFRVKHSGTTGAAMSGDMQLGAGNTATGV
jgi:hypothetical protein